MTNEYPAVVGMIFVGLLTHRQKQLGYWICQDEDFIYLFRRVGELPMLVFAFLYETTGVKEIRDKADVDIEQNELELISK